MGLGRVLGRPLARFLSKPRRRYERFVLGEEDKLRATLQPCDVLLVEGDSRISTAIKYLSQSTWSHACIHVGDALRGGDYGDDAELVEADLVEGVIGVPVAKYAALNTRVCRPIGLSPEERRAVVQFVVARLGHTYDLKNIFDLMRYLLPMPPVPSRWRRGLIAFGSGDPTRAICSTLIAQAFQEVRYPILPRYGTPEAGEDEEGRAEALLRQRHFTQFAPRDFDVSPYFEVVKPTLATGFDFHRLAWAELPAETGGGGAEQG